MEQRKFEGRNTRQFYRVEYPENERPTVSIRGLRYEIRNASEKSIKFICGPGGPFEKGDELSGEITFHDGETFEVEGAVYRLYEDGVVLCFTKGIPFSRIIKEQYFLMEKFKHLL